MARDDEKVAPPLTHRLRKILCAVDFSDCSRAALEIAADVARRLDAELTVVHVREDSAGGGGEAQPNPAETLRDVERNLARFKLYAAQYLDAPIRAKILAGDAAAGIVRFAEQGGFDLVVTGTHGRSGVKRMMLGSVAERVLRHAPCPVLIARAVPVASEAQVATR